MNSHMSAKLADPENVKITVTTTLSAQSWAGLVEALGRTPEKSVILDAYYRDLHHMLRQVRDTQLLMDPEDR